MIAPRCDAMFVIGAPNSSNSLRLVECAEREGTKAKLIQRATDIDFGWLEGVRTLGITAGASAPEVLVREVVAHLGSHFDVREQEVETAKENIAFKLPRVWKRYPKWLSTRRFPPRRWLVSSPAMTPGRCAPPKALPRASRTATIWSKPRPTASSSPFMRKG